MYTLLLATKVAHRLEPIELAAAFVGVLCHDLDHPGLSNTWQNNERTPLSVKYDGESPLEHHHLDMFLMMSEKHQLLSNLEPKQADRFREIVSEMILATDMARHAMLMKKITDKLSDASFDPMHDRQGINLLLAIALKCADISNQVRPWAVANDWNAVVYEEFYAEGDKDRTKGREVKPLLDRATNNIHKSTVGFIRFIVKPLYQIYADIMRRCADLDKNIDSRAVEECLYILDDNMQRYENASNGQANSNTSEQFESLEDALDLEPPPQSPLAKAKQGTQSVLADLENKHDAVNAFADLNRSNLPGINTDAGSNLPRALLYHMKRYIVNADDASPTHDAASNSAPDRRRTKDEGTKPAKPDFTDLGALSPKADNESPSKGSFSSPGPNKLQPIADLPPMPALDGDVRQTGDAKAAK